jgi:hypothetical protein
LRRCHRCHCRLSLRRHPSSSSYPVTPLPSTSLLLPVMPPPSSSNKFLLEWECG